MKHDQLTVGQDYWASGKPATDLLHYGVRCMRVLQTKRWRETGYGYGGNGNRTMVQAPDGGEQVSIQGKPDDKGQYVLVMDMDEKTGEPRTSQYGGPPVHLVHMGQLRGLWSELAPKRDAILQERADAKSERELAARQRRERAERIRLRLEAELGYAVTTELNTAGWVSVAPNVLEDVLDVVERLLGVIQAKADAR